MKLSDELRRAVNIKDCEGVEELLKSQDVNSVDRDGRTPLIHAILGSPASQKLVRLLIDSGATINMHDKGQAWTPLHYAAREQDLEVVKMLLEVGAEVEAVDIFGNTPLIRCVATLDANLAVISILMAYGADKNKNNNYGISAFSSLDPRQVSIKELFQSDDDGVKLI